MKKNIITLVAISLSLSGCGIYTKYEPATVVPDDLYGGEVVTEDTAGLGNMDWRELFTDPYLQSLIEVGLQTNTDYQSAQTGSVFGHHFPAVKIVGNDSGGFIFGIDATTAQRQTDGN